MVDQPAANAADPAASQEVKKATEVVRRQLADLTKQANKEKLKDAEQVLQKLEQGTKDLNREPMVEKRMTKLNDLSRLLASAGGNWAGPTRSRSSLSS